MKVKNAIINYLELLNIVFIPYAQMVVILLISIQNVIIAMRRNDSI